LPYPSPVEAPTAKRSPAEFNDTEYPNWSSTSKDERSISFPPVKPLPILALKLPLVKLLSLKLNK
jgi:hypothetical protein